jgi:hypothetical protein
MSIPEDPKKAGQREGRRRRDVAHAALEANRDHRLWTARRELLLYLLTNGTGTIDDIRPRIGTVDPDDSHWLGAIPGPLSRRRIIERVSVVTSSRAARHAGLLSRWRLIDQTAAEAWLREHPALSPPKAQSAPQKDESGQYQLPGLET